MKSLFILFSLISFSNTNALDTNESLLLINNEPIVEFLEEGECTITMEVEVGTGPIKGKATVSSTAETCKEALKQILTIAK